MKSPRRLNNWELTLAEVLSRWSTNTYDFAAANCLLFARETIMALIGGEPLARLDVTLQQVKTPVGAARLLAQYGSPAAIITAVLGPPVPLLQARRGDLAAVQGVNDVSIGVVDGDVIHCLSHDRGLEWRPLRDALNCWRLGV